MREMTSEIVLQALESLEFTQALEKEQRDKIAAISTYVTFSEGANIFREGDASELVYLIMEGEVSLTTQVPGHGQVIILTLGPGQLLGWSSLFLPQKKTAGARTTKPTKAVAINATQLLELCQADSQLGYAIMWRVAEIISNRLRAARSMLLDMFEPGTESG
jgi:CRP/FNR family cyclic AMP-dependent transcriptional regulator